MKQIDLYGDQEKRFPGRKRRVGKGLLAAVLCVALGYLALQVYWRMWPKPLFADLDRQSWSAGMAAEAYFPDAPDLSSDAEEITIISHICSVPYGGDRTFTHQRQQLAQEHAMPVLGEEYLPNCWAFYGEDGGLDVVTFRWDWAQVMDWGEISDRLIVNAAPAENADGWQDGHFLPSGAFEISRNARVTERDGVEILCAGREDEEKCIRFYDGAGWYQIYGGGHIPYVDMVRVLDFYLENPLDFARFQKDKGGEESYARLAEYPQAFEGYYPTDQLTRLCPALSYDPEIWLVDGQPHRLTCDYDICPDDTVVRWWSVYDERYAWHLDPWERASHAGDLDSLTKEDIEKYMKSSIMRNQHELVFSWDGYQISALLTTGATVDQVWELLCALKMRDGT